MNPIADHLWQSTLFTAVAGLLTLALQTNRARVRYWLWLTASCKFLVPLSVLVALGGQFTWRTAPVETQFGFSIAIKQVSAPFSAPAVSPPPPEARPSLPLVLAVIWACGFAGIAISWFVRWRRIRETVRSASPVQISVGMPVKSSPRLLEPGVFGIFRPVLLLPEASSSD